MRPRLSMAATGAPSSQVRSRAMTETTTAVTRDGLMGEAVARHPRSHQLFMEAQRYLPGGNTRTGVWFDPFPPYIDRAAGVFLYDVDGHEMLDFAFKTPSLILGHAHPAVVEALQRQAERGTGYNRPTEL